MRGEFSEDDVRRIARAVRAIEKTVRNDCSRDQTDQGRGDVAQLVRVTSTTPNAQGYYPCRVSQHLAANNTFTDLTSGDSAWAVDPNGIALSARYYKGRRVGPYTDGLPLFEVESGTAADTNLTYVSTTINYNNVTTNVTNTWTITGGTVTYSSTTINYNSTTVNYNSTSTIVMAGPTWNITANTTTTISNNVTWTITGGTLKLTNITFNLGTGVTWNITDNLTTTITGGKTWTVTGGTLDLTGTTTKLGTIGTGTWQASTIGVAYGGTGDTSFTAYSVICGGTTASGALQNVSGLGTLGQVLTSNGAGALPTWQTASGATLLSRVTTRFDKTDTSLADVTGLSVSVAANTTYLIEAWVPITVDPTGNCKISVGGTCNDTNFSASIDFFDDAGDSSITPTCQKITVRGTAFAWINTITSVECLVRGLITVGTNAGTLTIEFAQNSASGTSSVLVGAWLRATKIP